MMKNREPLDMYDVRPEAMTAFLRYNGWHFNKKLYEWAVGKMNKVNKSTGRVDSIDPWTKEEVDGMLAKYGIELENNTGYDYMYVAAMVKADFYKSSLQNEQQAAMFIKDMVDDVDQADGFILNRFYADCVRRGLPIPWDEVV